MLRSLHIENYVLIDSLDITFPESLIIITGQTGAGKSILLGALSLLLGGKGDAGHVGTNAENCVVEAECELDGEEYIIRRVLSRSGRSRSFVNDCPVQASELSELASRLVDIHSQHQSLLLTDKKYQLSILDCFAGVKEDALNCRGQWDKLRAAESELAELKHQVAKQSFDNDYNEAQLRQLQDARLRDGELEELEDEQKKLSNAEEIREGLAGAVSLRPDDALAEARKLLGRLSRFLPSVEDLSSRIGSAEIELADVFDELEKIGEGIDVSGDRLIQVEDRLSLLYSLLKKHGCRTVAELIEVRDRFEKIVGGAANSEERLADAEKAVASARSAYEVTCAALHSTRVEAAPRFAAEIMKDLVYLELERSVFKVEVTEAPCGPTGADSVIFSFSSTGTAPVEVSKCASGGEISRIMLCLKAMMARFEGMPTLVFDEIDTGVSGSVADKMGAMICQMGRTMQVIAITHLPQVAAKGEAHFVVTKEIRPDGTAVSGVNKVEGQSRTMEIARLLSGSSITPQAIANAESLLAEAKEQHI